MGRRPGRGLGPESQSFLTPYLPSPSSLTTSLVSSFSLNEDNKSICLRGLGKVAKFHGVVRTVPHAGWPSVVSSRCAYLQPWNCSCFPSEEGASHSSRRHPSRPFGPTGRSLTHSLTACTEHGVHGGTGHLALSLEEPGGATSECGTWRLKARLNMRPTCCQVISPSSQERNEEAPFNPQSDVRTPIRCG